MANVARRLRRVSGSRPLEYVGGKAVAFAGTTGTTNISLTDLAGGLAAAPAAGDFVLVAYSIGAGASIDHDVEVTTAGYDEIADRDRPDTLSTQLALFCKFMGGSPDTSVTVGGTGNVQWAGAVAIHVWRNVDTGEPYDHYAQANSPDYHRPIPPDCTPDIDGSQIIAVGGNAHRKGTGTYTSSDLDNFVTAGANDTVDTTVGMGSKFWETGDGLFNPAQFGFSLGNTTDTAESWIGLVIAIQPAS